MDVGGGLRKLGLDKYEAAFRENGIDAQVLRHVTAEDLREIGVATVGDRRKLLAAITELAASSPSTELSPFPSPAARPKTSEVSAERRPITVMFCDLVGSTSLAAKLDAEDWRNLVNAYLDDASAAVTGLGGHVLKRLGDGLMALFGYPKAQENDAERAVRAALAIQRALAELNARNAAKGAPSLSARIGLDSGPVVVERTGEVFGDAPNIAVRAQTAAEPGIARAPARANSLRSSASPASASRGSSRSSTRASARRRTPGPNFRLRNSCRTRLCTRSPNGAAFVLAMPRRVLYASTPRSSWIP
jgi:class 3 adenylate cyclase